MVAWQTIKKTANNNFEACQHATNFISTCRRKQYMNCNTEEKILTNCSSSDRWAMDGSSKPNTEHVSNCAKKADKMKKTTGEKIIVKFIEYWQVHWVIQAKEII